MYNLFRLRAVEEIVVDGSAVSAEGVGRTIFLAEIEARSPGVVEKEAVASAGVIGQEKRNAFIERVAALLEAVLIGVPHLERAAPAIQRAGLVAKAEVVLVRRHAFVDAKAVSMKLNRTRVLQQNVSVVVFHCQAKRGSIRRDLQQFGVKAYFVFLFVCGYGCSAGACTRKDGPRGIFRESLGARDADAENVIAQSRDLDACRSIANFHSVWQSLRTGHTIQADRIRGSHSLPPRGQCTLKKAEGI